MSSLNQVQLIGNLGRDPDIRNTAAGTVVANLSLATSEKWKDKSGEKQEKTEWHRVVFFGKVAEIIERYLAKGSKIFVQGRLETRKWTDNAGIEKYSTEIIGSDMRMLGGEPRSGGGPRVQHTPSQAPTQAHLVEDDIPF